MKLILQDMSKGGTGVVEAPTPKVIKEHLVIDTSTTLISSGTERTLVDFGQANLVEKALAQPDKVKMVLEKIKTDGLMTTFEAVQSKLSQPLALGYSNVGVIHSVGQGISEFKVGDRVVSNGSHANVVRVPKNLCAKIPDNVTDEEASFTVVASIGLQGIRLAQPTLGESFVVTGVGLIGLLTVQLLRAQGCRVLAIDFDDTKLELAKLFGAETCNPSKGEDPISAGKAFSRGKGVDGVIITASTKSNDPVTQAARMSRKRGRIILVGVTGLELNRADFYEKELTFQVSCSYGPGRYDSEYENKGHDYPYAFVRWTEQRNFEAILDMMSSGQLDVKPLITHRFSFDSAPSAYQVLVSDKAALGIILQYKEEEIRRHSKTVTFKHDVCYQPSKPIVGFVGAGNYASRILIPAFIRGGAQLHTLSTSGGVSAVTHGEKAGFTHATTDTQAMMAHPEINTIAIVTRHNSHAKLVIDALNTGKNVFVEKPLAITYDELKQVKEAYFKSLSMGNKPKLMVGFNRRFSPHVQKMKALLDAINEPKSFIMTVNAGSISSEHWTQDSYIGGGRIIGEACHFVDLMRYLAGAEIVSVQSRRMGAVDGISTPEDKATFILGFANGSFGTIHYLANGAASFPKERIEVFAAGRVLQLDNFRKLRGFGWPDFKKMNLWKQDKGQRACAMEFLKAIETGSKAPISIDELFEVANVTIGIAEELRNQQ